jgi:Mg-chelatase subunit ChlI
MTPEAEALARVVRHLDDLGIVYMLAGSMASSFHGRPRTTHDADIVIDPDPEQLDRLVKGLVAAGFYVDAQRAKDALRRRRQFNAIDMSSAFKLDLVIRRDRPFSREELGRRQRVDLEGTFVALATAEDTILTKLEWARLAGGSQRQLADACGIVDVRGDELDHAYIERWAGDLGVLDLWDQILRGEP